MRSVTRKIAFCVIASVLLLSAACRGEGGAERDDRTKEAPKVSEEASVSEEAFGPDEAPVEQGDESPAAFEGTAGITEKRRDHAGPALVRAVRTATHRGFDRVVFEFGGSSTPGYHVEYVDGPVRRCGSGQAVPVAGDAWLLVRLRPALMHTEEGRPTVGVRERRFKFPLFRELESICDFEADVEWVLGLSSPNRYRVLELKNPPRIVVDVKH